MPETTTSRAIIDLLGEWPFPIAPEIVGHWLIISEEHRDAMNGALPPIYFKGGWFMGEAARHDLRGVAVHAAVVHRGDTYYMREVAIDPPSIEQALAELDESIRLI